MNQRLHRPEFGLGRARGSLDGRCCPGKGTGKRQDQKDRARRLDPASGLSCPGGRSRPGQDEAWQNSGAMGARRRQVQIPRAHGCQCIPYPARTPILRAAGKANLCLLPFHGVWQARDEGGRPGVVCDRGGNEARRPSPRIPSGRRVFWPGPSLARPSQPASGDAPASPDRKSTRLNSSH